MSKIDDRIGKIVNNTIVQDYANQCCSIGQINMLSYIEHLIDIGAEIKDISNYCKLHFKDLKDEEKLLWLDMKGELSK